MSPGFRTLCRFGAVVVALVAVVSSASPSNAAGGLVTIVCGGVKHGTDWQTNSTGGYTGEGCGSGIDWVATPTSSSSNYHFGTTDGASYTFQAYIPTNHANAIMDFHLLVCGTERTPKATVRESQFNGRFVSIFTLSGYSGCDVTIEAATGMASSGYLGLDAVRSHT